MHINKFIHDMQQHIADLTDEQFDNRVKSLIKLYQERMKNIDEEAGIYEGHVCANSYMFNTCDIKVGFLQSIAKAELLELWNRYVNPSTAAAYTRIDVQMWSTKIWKPTESDFKGYSAKTLALYGCMHSEGNVDLDIGKVDEFIVTAIATLPEQVENSDDSDTALALAVKDHEMFGDYGNVSHTNFATIGMEKTPDGLWLMTDYKKFQATQKLYGLGVPAEVLVPKYSS
ncbi:metalloprotease [Coemansia sp. RSA 2611]|nr:metalloprotease [Coemansia sp. RSA 2611]